MTDRKISNLSDLANYLDEVERALEKTKDGDVKEYKSTVGIKKQLKYASERVRDLAGLKKPAE